MLLPLFYVAFPPESRSLSLPFRRRAPRQPSWGLCKPRTRLYCHLVLNTQRAALCHSLVFSSIPALFLAVCGVIIDTSGLHLALTACVVDFTGSTGSTCHDQGFGVSQQLEMTSSLRSRHTHPIPPHRFGKFNLRSFPRDLPRQPSTYRRLGRPQLWSSIGSHLQKSEGEGQ